MKRSPLKKPILRFMLVLPIIIILSLFYVYASSFIVAEANTAQNEFITYTVKQGDNVYTIWRNNAACRYDEFMYQVEMDNDINAGWIYPWQVLLIRKELTE